MFGAPKPRNRAPAGSTLPPPPAGFDLDPVASIRATGANVTSSYRPPEHNRRVGGVPGSLHTDGSAWDLTPAKGQSWSDLHRQADTIARQYGNGARAIDESKTRKPHIHLQLPGSHAGLPPPPAGFAPVEQPAIPSEPLGVDPYTQPMSAAESKRLADTIPESYIEAARIKAVMHPHNSAPAPANLFAGPPMTPAQELSNINGILAEGQGLPPVTPPPSRLGIAPLINATAGMITGDDGTADTSTYVGGFFDELPQEVRQRLDTQQIEQYIALARSKPSAQQLTDMFGGWGYDIGNADEIASALAKGAKVNRSVRYELPNRQMQDGGTGSFVRGVADPFNFLDEGAAIVDTLTGAGGRESIWNSDRSFSEIRDSNIDQNRGILAADERDHPYARLGGQLSSGILLPYGAGARTPGALAKIGTAEGFAAGLGAGEGNIIERLPNAAVGAGFGAAGGYGIGKLIEAGAPVVSAARNRFLGSASPNAAVARDAAYAAAPVANDGAQALGPTPASRFQPQGGSIAGFEPPIVAFRRQAAEIEAGLPPVAPGHVRLWRGARANENGAGRNFTTDLPGIALPFRKAYGGDLRYLDLPEADLPAYSMADGAATDAEFHLPTALTTRAKSVREFDGVPWPISSAAMRMDDDSPSISERARDYINIPPPPPGFRPEAAPMLRVDDASRLMDVEDAAKGLDPESVLPPEAYAPDEMAGLGTRAFAKAGARSAYQRGPVDLVGFVRSAGGLKDEGGDLRHLGIDNKPRDLDFAKGEGFLGGLVRDDGHSLDDMAEAAWEAGYFPEFPERPSVNDFLDALADTHSGASRRFIADDLNEVAEFEAAREQRLAMEAAGQDAPEVLRVANIDVTKIETPQDIRQAVNSINSAIGQNPSLKRVSHNETAELAEQLGMTPETFLKRRQGQALNHAEAYALRNLHAASLDQTVTLARKAIGGSDADRAKFLQSASHTAWLQDHVSGAAAEAGRALSQYRMIGKATKQSAEAVRNILNGRGGHENIDKMAEALIELSQDPADASRFVQKITRPGFKDMFNEYYINGLVSGPRTHAVNIISNLVTAGLQLPEHAAAAALGALRRGSTDKVYFSELGPRLTGMLQGARTGLANAKVALMTGRASDDTHKVESRFQHAIPGKFGHVVRIPTRLLTAEDEFFKGMALGSELASRSVRMAKAEGLKGEALTRRIAELNANPTDEMLAAGKDFARYVTFQRQLGDLGSKVSQITNQVPGVKIMFPFIRTPTNLLKYAVERSPAAPLLKEWRADMAAGGARRDLAIVRASSGTALGALAASWAAQGVITGGGPADQNERRILMADGWQPYSIKVGDRYYSYARLDPLATTLGMAADYVDKQSEMTPRQAEESAATLTASIIQNLENKIWLQGMADLGQALDDPQRYGGAYVRKTLATIAVPVGVSQLSQSFDATPREAKTLGEAVQSRVPGLSGNLRPRLDAWGRPQLKEGGVGPDIVSPFAMSTQRNEAINQEALRLNLKVSDPSRTVAKRRLSDEEYHAYRLKAGEFLTQRFAEIVASPEWRQMTDDEKRKEFERPISGIKALARKDARESLGLAAGEGEDATPPPPAGFVIPPPPSGFTIAE